MDNDKLAKRLLATFQEELAEHVGALNENLLALEKDPGGAGSAERIKSLFRAAHSLKGAARAVALKPIEEMCHHLEEVLRAVQNGVLPLGEETFAILFAAADALEDASKRLAAGKGLSGAPLEELAPRLVALAAKRAGARPQPPAPGRPAPAAPPAPAVEGQVRVAATKLDTLLARCGELLVAERRLERTEAGVAAVGELLGRMHREWRQASKDARLVHKKRAGSRPAELAAKFATARADLDRLGTTLRDDRRAIGRAVSLMDEDVRRVRLLPFAEACQALDRAVRDLAKERGKEVEVAVEGASIEIDRSILEGLKDPLLALARNAVDHGVELPAQRRAAGKPERGRVAVAAALRGSRVEVSVADDGAGVDLAAVRERARQRGLSVPRDDRECVALLFEPGFSTAARVTEISGRGVGLDIVKTRAAALHGTVELTSQPGRGTRVTFTLPATLTTLRALLVASGGETFAVPGAGVVRLLRFDPVEIKSVGGREVVAAGEGPPVPVFSLARVLSLPERGEQRSGKISAMLVGAQSRAAFAVDELIAEREILVKALGPRLRSVRNLAGATILETGRVALILNVAELIRAALERPGEAALAIGPAAPLARKRIILADDSVTTRSLERAILEAAGYEVLAAVDGEQAFRLLQERGADLMVSDVDMPRMDGLALCKAIRGSKRFRDLPVVLVSGLESEQDRARGGEAGADAYIVKSEFDQRDLLTMVATLLGAWAVIRVLVVEDSDTARELLLGILASEAQSFTVIGEAKNGLEAVEMTRRLRPDVVTMDIRMPLLDGLDATRRIMSEAPTPVVVVSGSDVLEVQTSLEALRAGALAVIEKPAGPAAPGFEERCRTLLRTVKLMAGVKVVRRFAKRTTSVPVAPLPRIVSEPRELVQAVAIATSTGGPAALQTIFSRLPGDFPVPILVVQHIARGFLGGLASWLGSTSKLRVKIAVGEEPIVPGIIYLAPDDRHLGVTVHGRIVISAEAPVSGFRPSGTFLFESAARALGARALAVILTGMGRDGVEGLQRVKATGGRILVQDEASSVVFGMPAAAIEAGLADEVVALDDLAGRLLALAAT